LIAADGAVKLDNIDLFIGAGARRICVGSAIMKAADPVDSYASFLKKIKEKVG
jgi:thiamine monophosphate synthase